MQNIAKPEIALDSRRIQVPSSKLLTGISYLYVLSQAKCVPPVDWSEGQLLQKSVGWIIYVKKLYIVWIASGCERLEMLVVFELFKGQQ